MRWPGAISPVQRPGATARCNNETGSVMSAVSVHSEFLHHSVPGPVPQGFLPGTLPRRAVFLDRDGVITEDPGYLHKPEDVHFLPGAIAAIARLNDLGLPVVLVTNQSGIGRGFYAWADFELVQQRIQDQLGVAGARLDAVWACGYNPRTTEPNPSAAHFRKPGPGMILEAAAALSIDLPASCVIGDKTSDIGAAIRAGVGTAVHVLTGEGSSDRAAVEALSRRPESQCRILFAGSLAEAVPMLEAAWASPRP